MQTARSPFVAHATAASKSHSSGMPWGEPIWTFFHALAEQVDADRYAECRADLARIVRDMAANLPCPECSAHAVAYHNARVNWAALRTREDFRQMLCAHHNAVNARKGRPQFDPADLPARYGSLDLAAVAARALFFFEGRHSLSNIGLGPHSMQKARTAAAVRAWMTANLGRRVAIPPPAPSAQDDAATASAAPDAAAAAT